MRRVSSLFGIITLGLLAAPAFAADTLDDVLKKVGDYYNNTKTYSMKMKTVVDSDQGGMKMKMDSDAITEFKRGDGKKYYSRSEAKMNSDMSGPGFSNKSSTMTVAVVDGDVMMTLTENLDGPEKGKKTATKSKVNFDIDPVSALKQTYDLKLLADEKVDGQDCWVLEGKNKAVAGQPAQDADTKLYFRKDNGVMVKSVTTMAGKPYSTMTCTDVKINGSIADDRFKLKIPDGVEVQDFDKMMAEAGAGQPEAGGDKKVEEPKEQPKDQPKEEPKKEEPKKKPALPKLP